MKRAWSFGSLLVLVVCVSVTAFPLPRFASRSGAKCQSCHINPAGGGMRQAFGAQYGRETLPVPEWSEDFELTDFTTLLTSFIGVGADFRVLYFYQQQPDTGTAGGPSSANAFWQMQGDLYLNLKIAKNVNLYLDKGLYSGFEVFGLLNILPWRGHVKVGKFIPNYGTKLDDHTAYIRRYTGFSPEFSRPELTGIEAGVSPGWFAATAGIYNAEDGFGSNVLNDKALLGRVEGIVELSDGMHLGLGGNVFATSTDGGLDRTIYGGLGSFTVGGFTVFGEYDWIVTDETSGTVTGVAGYVEAGYPIVSGVDLKLAYDFYDGDQDVKSGATSRYSVGVEFFPLPGVELRPIYRFVVDDPDDVSNDEFTVQFHLYL